MADARFTDSKLKLQLWEAVQKSIAQIDRINRETELSPQIAFEIKWPWYRVPLIATFAVFNSALFFLVLFYAINWALNADLKLYFSDLNYFSFAIAFFIAIQSALTASLIVYTIQRDILIVWFNRFCHSHDRATIALDAIAEITDNVSDEISEISNLRDSLWRDDTNHPSVVKLRSLVNKRTSLRNKERIEPYISSIL